MTTARACLWVVLVWATIYLPALGSLEIKGEEGRRILPAVAMLDTGRWIVPQVGGVPYLSKPPLINWLVAAAFRASGTRSEWAARAPSALAVLALAVTAVGSLSAFLSPAGALLTAIFLLTNIGLMEKGRLAEIEALYLSLYGIALCSWLGAWRRDMATSAKPSWRTWAFPWIFLGFGLLTKGPLHLLFFYAVVVAILLCAGRARDLWNRWHLLGVVLMLGIFAAWAVPYLRQTAANGAGGVWLAQFQGRMEVNEAFRFQNWLLNIPRGLVNFLPWVVLLPLAWRRIPTTASATADDKWNLAVLRGLRWGVGGCFLAVSLAPGGQPRYTLPLLVPASMLLGMCLAPALREKTSNVLPPLPGSLPLVWGRVLAACVGTAIVGALAAVPIGESALWERWGIALVVFLAGWQILERRYRWSRLADFPMLALASAVGMALLTADFAVSVVPRLRRGESVRPVGHRINRSVGRGETVAVLRPGFLPFLFYVHDLRYLQTPGELPPFVAYLLVRENDLDPVAEVLRQRQWTHRIALTVNDKRVKDPRLNTWLLLRLDPISETSL